MTPGILSEIKLGLENVKIAIKEKYLGREFGKRRGETIIMYSNDLLTITMSSCMILILSYVSYQIKLLSSKKLW